MTTTTRINSANDLRNYIDDHMGGDATPGDIDAVLKAIQLADHPAFGGDWTEYLEPLDLWQMIDEDDVAEPTIDEVREAHRQAVLADEAVMLQGRIEGLKAALEGVSVMLNSELKAYATEPWAVRVRAALDEAE